MIFLKYLFRHHKSTPVIIFILISIFLVLDSEIIYISKPSKDMLLGAVISIMISMFFEIYKIHEKYSTHKNILKKFYTELVTGIELFFNSTNTPILQDMMSYNETIFKKTYDIDLMESSIKKNPEFINIYQKVLIDYRDSYFISAKDTPPRNHFLMQNQFNKCQDFIREHIYKQVSSIYYLVMQYTENKDIINNLYKYKVSIDGIMFTDEKYLLKNEINLWYLMDCFISISIILRPLLNDECSLLGNDDYN